MIYQSNSLYTYPPIEIFTFIYMLFPVCISGTIDLTTSPIIHVSINLLNNLFSCLFSYLYVHSLFLSFGASTSYIYPRSSFINTHLSIIYPNILILTYLHSLTRLVYKSNRCITPYHSLTLKS